MGSLSDNVPLRDERPVFFFDIDNCLYPLSYKIHDLMQVLIRDFFVRHLSISEEEAKTLHLDYYKQYGLAIEGLTRHHKIDPIAFNHEVDDALPLDDIMKPDPKVQQLLIDLDTTKVKPWLLTNAHINHAKRVIKLIGVEEFFEGITYCDYANPPLVCKPRPEMYDKAEKEAGAPSTEQCYFVDDSHLNCRHAYARGWHVAHLLEPELPEPEARACKHQIQSLEELRDIFPQFFKSSS